MSGQFYLSRETIFLVNILYGGRFSPSLTCFAPVWYVYPLLFSLQDEAMLKDLVNTVEGLDAHMEYIQENITESQGTIMGMEVR